MTRGGRHSLLGATFPIVVSATAVAQTSDPSAGRGHLQQGFALKEQGRCDAAIPYFLESMRFDRQSETLLYLADCELQLGNVGAASAHYIEARDLADWQGLAAQRAMAEQRLLAINRPLPPPSGGTGYLGWGTAAPAGGSDPGIGPRIAGFGLMGVGAVGVAIGTIFGLKVSEKNSEIDSICPTGQPCPPQSVVAYNQAVADAKIDRAASLVSFGVAAVFVATGAVLVLTAPKRLASGMAVWVAPSIGGSQSGAALGGTW